MKYYNGLNDIVFKNTLCVEEHKGLLKWLLESCLDIKIDNLILKDKELSKKTKYSKGRVVDLLIESDNKMFNVEINNRPHDYNNDRNLGYLANLYGKSIDKSNDYKKINSCIQLNITSGKKDIELKSKYLLVDTLNESKNIWTDKFKGNGTEYVVGGPSLDMVLNSYNQYTGQSNMYQTKVENKRGYKLSADGGRNWDNYLKEVIDNEL